MHQPSTLAPARPSNPPCQRLGPSAPPCRRHRQHRRKSRQRRPRQKSNPISNRRQCLTRAPASTGTRRLTGRRENGSRNMTKKILGHIDCPSCGTAKGMRISADRNGDPFGFCEAECGQQLRIGGNVRRVRAFLARFPWAAGAPVTGTVTEPATPAAPPVTVAAPVPAPARPAAPAAPKAPATKPAPTPPPAPAKKAGWFQPIIGSKHG
jgi:hypothetical protein